MSSKPSSEEAIFDAAIQLATRQERAAYLKKACGSDSALRGRVEDLLRAHDEAGEFLETPLVTSERALADSTPATGQSGETSTLAITEKPGDTIGRYKLLQVIGEGGCGVVYMAEQQEPVRRRVAFKIIKLGMDTKSVIARFEVERQALALMDHPNIAKVLDAGATETGRPFFVMELVRGIRITEFCDQNNLPTEERLKLFMQVCRAIQHAHQKGIIHRDIKPSNILVTLHDGVPVAKVIDFGIAKATEQRLTDKTLFTEFQAFIGTPAYVSPEQAEMSGLDIDTRSDIYSLGVLLYELLTGRTPFDPEELARSGLDEMRRTIRESEPARPSNRLSTMLHAELTTTAKRRQVEPPKLISRIRGDLDWIVMKCLEKDRTRRYETVNLLTLDIERFLNQEAVFARPPSKIYLLQKMVRRNRAAFIGASSVAAALIVGLIVSTVLFFRERDARKDAVTAEREQTRLLGVADQARASEAEQRQRAEAERHTALRTAYNSDMNVVQQAMTANNFGRAVGLLNRHWPGGKPEIRHSKSATEHDFRQWEWRYFWSQLQSDAAFALPRQSNSVVNVAISSDGRFLASNARDGGLKLWDLFRRAEVATFREQGSGFGSGAGPFAFSPKGDRLAVVINRGPRQTSVSVRALPTREIVVEFFIDRGAQALTFTPGGAKLIVLGGDMAIRAWDFEKQDFGQETPVRLQMEGFRRRTVHLSPDAQRAALSDDEGNIRFFDLNTGAELFNVPAFERASIARMAFSPDGELLAVTSFVSDTVVKLFSVKTGREVGQLVGHASWIPGLTFTADGKRLISAGADQTIRIWDIVERRELTALRGHLSEVNCVAVTGDGKTIVSGCKDGTLFGWDAEQIQRKKSFETLPTPVASVEFLPNSEGMLTVNASDGSVSLWDWATLQEKERLSVLGHRVTRIITSPDGMRIYAGYQDGEIKVLDWPTRAVITNLPSPVVSGRGFPGRGFPGPGRFPGRSASGPIALIESGRTLLAAGPGPIVRLWDTTSWRLKTEWKSSEGFPGHGGQMILSPDERLLAVTSFGGAIEFRNVQTGVAETTLSASDWGASGIAFSPDGNLFATSSGEGTLTLWNVSETKIVDVLRGHLLGVHAVAFSPDGQRIASGSVGNEAVKLWDAVTRQEAATLAAPGLLSESVTFSPGGRMLVAISRERVATIWRAPSLAEIEAIEKAQLGSTP